MAAEGRLEIRDWTDNDGNKRRIAEVNVSKAYFGGDKPKKPGQEAYGSPAPSFEDLPDDDGQLPF